LIAGGSPRSSLVPTQLFEMACGVHVSFMFEAEAAAVRAAQL